MAKKDQKDTILIEKLEKLLENPNYDYSLINDTNKAIIRPNWNKYFQIAVKEYEKKLMIKINNFWDIAIDFNPQFCFITGKYIPLRFKNIKATKPFSNGQWCYKEDYDRYINHNNISEKVDENSMIICIASQPKEITDKTKRSRIKNNLGSIIDYISNNLSDFDEADIPKNMWDLDIKLIKFKYFLKPSGKPFPKPKSY